MIIEVRSLVVGMVCGKSRKSGKGWSYGYQSSTIELVGHGLFSGIFVWTKLGGYEKSYIAH